MSAFRDSATRPPGDTATEERPAQVPAQSGPAQSRPGDADGGSAKRKRPPSRRKQRKQARLAKLTPAQRRRRKIVRRTLLAAVLAFLGWLGWSIGGALTAPGTDTTSARLAEWGREHGLTPVVTYLEEIQYKMHPPKVGGKPGGDSLKLLQGQGAAPQTAKPGAIPLRPPMEPFATPAIDGEGTWKPLVTSADGQPIVQAAYLRPDSTHTSYVAGVVWIDQKRTRYVLHPGFDEPGKGAWSQPDMLPADQRAGLVATWNGAFKLADAQGGYYEDGRTAGTLKDGAASEIFYKDGSITVGAWGRDATMTPDVVGVRQNLKLLVDGGQIAGNVDADIQQGWGATIKGADYVWRSGVGVTQDGDIVYASGGALSARTLAQLLQRAGAVRAMELDINPSWVSFMTYSQQPGATGPVPAKLLPFQRPADRYFQESSRDFVAVYERP